MVASERPEEREEEDNLVPSEEKERAGGDVRGAAGLPDRSRGKLQAGPTNEKNRAN